MIVQLFTVGKFSTNCYAAVCEQTRESIIIDPGFDGVREAGRIFKFIDENSSTLKFIVNTHGHSDHTCGNGMINERYHSPILIHECDAHLLGEAGKQIAEFFGFQTFSPPAHVLLHDGDSVKFGKTNLKVIHTPGHSPGSISLLGENEIFTGDTLFAGSIGRTDFPESSENDMERSLKRLKCLPDCLVVYPGHGSITTLGEEKGSNPFL